MHKTLNWTRVATVALILSAGFALPASAQDAELHLIAKRDRLPIGIDDSDQGPIDALPVPGKDGLGPAPSPTPNKQDREDLLGAEAPLADPVLRAEALKALYDELRAAPDAEAAAPITEAIERAWRTSGSDTVDLLMLRVDAFVLSAKLDLAAEVLDAVTELAPDNAEAWHQRAIVSFMQKDSRRALNELRRSLSLDPRHYKAIRDLGMMLEEIDDQKGALEAYRQALEINPYLEQAKKAVEELVPDVEGRDI